MIAINRTVTSLAIASCLLTGSQAISQSVQKSDLQPAIGHQAVSRIDDSNKGSPLIPVPGEIITLEFRNLPPMANGQASQCEIRIPENYTPDKDFPLFVWFNHQRGSHRVSRAYGMVDPEQFIVVALPYPKGELPRLAVDGKTIDFFWDYLEPMLKAVKEVVPNISKDIRIATGSGSGAHLIGSGISLEWPGFADYFTAYALHAGGYAPSEEYYSARGKPMLIVYGENSEALGWQEKFNETIKTSGADLTFASMPGDGHALSGKGRSRIREWTDKLLKDSRVASPQ